MNLEKATLAGGCFWGVEELFQKLSGVENTIVGYTGGTTENPTYETVKTGETGHAESIEISFDSRRISYSELLIFFFKMHDPTQLNRQGNDRGSQYRSEIFFHSEEQKKAALEIIKKIDLSEQWQNPLVTVVSPAQIFYSAEEYHQDYLKKNPGGYTCHFIRD